MDNRTLREKRVSPELTEVRTVLSRAMTALRTIENRQHFRRFGSEEERARLATDHTMHEVAMMKSALMRTIEDLNAVERMAGRQ